MTSGNLGRTLGAAVILLIVVSGTLWGQSEEGDIPLTTSSTEAREFLLKGLDMSDRMRLQEARDYFKQAVAADPNFALAHLNLAMVQPSAKESLESFYRALALADKASEAERLLILASQAGFNAATMKQEEYLKKLVELYPQVARVHNQLGTFYFSIQDYPSAIAEFEKAIKINPELLAPYNLMGYSYRYLGNYAAAEKALQKYIDLIPDDPNPYDSYAELLLEMGKFEKSIEYYRKALKISPDFVASYMGIATNYNLMDKHQAAREELKKFYEIARDDGQRRTALFTEAVSYVDEGNLPEALNCLRKQYSLAEAFEDIPSMASDLNIRGTILLEMGQYDDAMMSYKKSVKMIESSDMAQEIIDNARRAFIYYSARIALMRGDFAAAQEKAEKYRALATQLNNPYQIRLSHELAGQIALAENEYGRAIEELTQANPQNPYNYYRLALAYRGAGDMEKAREACEKAAHYNALNNMNYAFIRIKAEEMLKSL